MTVNTYTGSDGNTYIWDDVNLICTASGSANASSIQQGILTTNNGQTINMTSMKKLVLNLSGWFLYKGMMGCTALTEVEFTRIGAIDNYTFQGCTGLTVLRFPSTLTRIDLDPFYGCTNLRMLIFDGNAPSFRDGSMVMNGCSQTVDVYTSGWTIPSNATSDTQVTYTYHTGIPETYKQLTIGGYKVKVESAERDGNGYKISTRYAKKSELATVATSGSYNDLTNKPTIPTGPHIISNTSVSSWSADNTYSDYPYRASIAITGVTASDVAEVIYGLDQATSGDYAPICETYAGGVYVYSAVNTAITIPTIIVTKG